MCRLIGHAAISLAPLLQGFSEISGWYHVVDFKASSQGQLKLRIVPVSFGEAATTRASSRPLLTLNLLGRMLGGCWGGCWWMLGGCWVGVSGWVFGREICSTFGRMFGRMLGGCWVDMLGRILGECLGGCR
jgi:hypothetical protein